MSDQNNESVCPMSRAAFKWQIGDTVTHMAFVYNAATRGMERPQKLFIVGRRSDECPGGVQRHYGCRAVTHTYGQAHFVDPLYWLNEAELCALPVEADPR